MKKFLAITALATVAPCFGIQAADELIDFPGPGYRQQVEGASRTRAHAESSLDFVVTEQPGPITLSSNRLNELRAQIKEVIRLRQRPTTTALDASPKR